MVLGFGLQQSTPTMKILVIDDDDSTANTIAASVDRGSCEVIWCRDMAMAEVAIDITEFDLVLVAPQAAGVDGVEGLAVADFVAARNPGVTTLLLPEGDLDLRDAIERRGAFRALCKPLCGRELQPFLMSVGAPVGRAVVA